GLLDPRPRGLARDALEPAVCNGWRRIRRNRGLLRLFWKPLPMLRLLALHVLVVWSSDGGNGSDLERYPGRQHGRRRLGIRAFPRLEVEGRVPLDELRQLHQDLRSGHQLHRIVQPCRELHVFAVEQREHQSEGIIPYLPHRSGLRPPQLRKGALLSSDGECRHRWLPSPTTANGPQIAG